MVHDMYRFILQSRSIIEQAPLQIYCSSLIFAPAQSTIRTQFKHYLPDWIRKFPKVQEDWSPLLQTLEGHSDWTNDIAFSVDGGMAASASNDHTIRLWDTVTGSTQALLEGHTASVKAVSYSPDGRLLASGSNDYTVRLWNPNTGAESGVLRGHTALINAIAFDPRGGLLTSVSNDKSVRIWDLKKMSCRHSLLGHTNWVNDVAYSPDGSTLATVAGDTTIRLWNLEKAELDCKLRGVKGGMGWLNCVSVSRKNLLAAGSANGKIYLWDLSKKSQIGVFCGHTSGINVVTFSYEEDVLVSGSNDCTVRLWQTAQYRAMATLERHTGGVMGVAASPRESLIASVSADGTVRFWDTANRLTSTHPERPKEPVAAVNISPDGQWAASIYRNNTGHIWNMSTESPLNVLIEAPPSTEFAEAPSIFLSRPFPECPDIPWSHKVAFTSNSKKLAVTWAEPIVYHWEMADDDTTWSHVGFEAGEVFPVLNVVFAPNNRFLASQSTDLVVRLWDIASGNILTTLSGHRDAVSTFCFSPCSHYLAVGSLDGSIYVWEIIPVNIHTTFVGHSASVISLKFSSDSQYLLSGSTGSTARLWKLTERKFKKILWVGDEMSIKTVGFLDYDTLAFAISECGKIITWQISNAERKILLGGNCAIVSPARSTFGWLNWRANVFCLRDRSGESKKDWNVQAIQSTDKKDVIFTSIIFSTGDTIVALVQDDDRIQILSTISHFEYCTIDMSRGKIKEKSPTQMRQEKINGKNPMRIRLSRRPKEPSLIVKFSPWSDRLACVSQNFVYIWDPRTGICHNTLAHDDRVNCIAFSPNGDEIASTSNDGTIRLWEVATGLLKSTMVINGTRSAVFLGNGLFSSAPNNRELAVKREVMTVTHRPLFVSNPWINYRKKNLIWLPVEYRATCSAVNKDTLVMGHGSGESTTIEFNTRQIPDYFLLP